MPKADLAPPPRTGPPPVAARFTTAKWIGDVELLGNDKASVIVIYASREFSQDRIMRELFWYELASRPHIDQVVFQL